MRHIVHRSHRRNRGISLLLFLIVTSLMMKDVKAETTALYKVTGIGETRDKAVNDALRNAIETVCGVYIESNTTVKLAVLIEDDIVSSSAGYIKSYRIISESRDETGMFSIVVEADVATDHSEISKLLKKLLGDRCARVSIKEYIESELQSDSVITPALEQFLITKNYVLMTADYGESTSLIEGSVMIKRRRSKMESHGIIMTSLDSLKFTVSDITGQKIAIVTHSDLPHLQPGSGETLIESGKDTLKHLSKSLVAVFEGKIPSIKDDSGRKVVQ